MKNEFSEIDVSKIPDAPRYLFTVDYIFNNPYATVAAFEKQDTEAGYHIQEFYEICIISKGRGYHFIEDTCVKASYGDVFIVPPGRKHAFVGGKGFNVYYIHLSPKFLNDYTPKMKAMPSFLALFEIEPLMRANGAKYRHLYLDSDAMQEVLSILSSIILMLPIKVFESRDSRSPIGTSLVRSFRPPSRRIMSASPFFIDL